MEKGWWKNVGFFVIYFLYGIRLAILMQEHIKFSGDERNVGIRAIM